MRASRGQSLVELAVCAPLVLLLALGAAAVVRLQDAESGLEAATQAAAITAARAPDASAAQASAQSRFAAVVSAYPVSDPRLSLDTGTFVRGTNLTATGSGRVDLGSASLAGLPPGISISSSVSVPLQWWRSHR